MKNGVSSTFSGARNILSDFGVMVSFMMQLSTRTAETIGIFGKLKGDVYKQLDLLHTVNITGSGI